MDTSDTPSFLTDVTPPKRVGFLSVLRNNFFYGLMIILPIFATIWLTNFTIKFIAEPLQSVSEGLLPLWVSFLLTLLIITMTGLLARNVIGKHLVQFLEDLLYRIPFVNVVYKSSKQIIDGFSMQKQSLMKPVLAEYPRKDLWTIGFLVKAHVDLPLPSNHSPDDYWCAIFLPTAPNPTSGYFIYLLNSELIYLNLSAEECLKIVMSVGILSPSKKS